jgi:hypothetical protein
MVRDGLVLAGSTPALGVIGVVAAAVRLHT